MLIALWMALAAGRALAAPAVPPPPADGLFDASSALNDGQRAAAVKAIGQARAAGVELYVALYNFVIDETIERRAERLKDAWCPSGTGLLVVADLSTQQCTYLSHVADTEWLSTTELQGIFTEASKGAASVEGSSADKLLAVIENLAPRLSDAMARHRELTRHRVSPLAWWVFGIVTVAVFALLCLAGIAVRLRRRHRLATVPQPHYFPTVEVGERYGAPFGGGVIAEVRFGGGGPSHPAA
jgi:hypothetical protein